MLRNDNDITICVAAAASFIALHYDIRSFAVIIDFICSPFIRRTGVYAMMSWRVIKIKLIFDVRFLFRLLLFVLLLNATQGKNE